MMQELYTHLEAWLLKDNIEARRNGPDWVMPRIQNAHQNQVAHCLKWMKEVFFKKD
jgi:hypothetical protein